MPRDLFLLRHGESEGNLALRAMRNGDDSLLTHPEFSRQHSSRWRLTARGREQAGKAGAWLNENATSDFDRLYTSEYARAVETAGELQLEQTAEKRCWRISPYLRERNWGDIDRATEAERASVYQRNLLDQDITPYYWRPPNGESLVEVSARLHLWINTLQRDQAERVIAVAHGEVIDTIRIELERMNEHDFMAMQNGRSGHVGNCSLIHYTRSEPGGQTELERYGWRRQIDPTGARVEVGEFEEIERQQYNSDQLLRLVQKSPNFF